MATIQRFPVRDPHDVRTTVVPALEDADGFFGHLGRLLKLEVELGLAEGRELIVSALVAVAVGVAAGIVLIASLVVLVAGALAPIFGAHWPHLVVAGGGSFVLAAAAGAWSAWRLTHLRWPPDTVRSFEENWRWLAAQLRSRLTSQ
jgi:hypothetical protein